MSTPFSDVYNRFLRKISDYRLSNQIQSDLSAAEDSMYGWLESAIPRFSKCKTNLSDRDETLKQFNNTLSDYEEEILSILMLVEWLRPEVNNILEMRNILNNSDFKTYSSANLLKEKKDLLDNAASEADRLIVDYTYITADFSQLG